MSSFLRSQLPKTILELQQSAAASAVHRSPASIRRTLTSTRVVASSILNCNKGKKTTSHFISQSIANNNNSIHNRFIHVTSIRWDEIRILKCPALSESLSEGDIRWEKAVGDSVAEDELVGEIETDKTSIPINAPAAGVVEELLVEDGSTVTPGTDIMKLKVGAGGGASKPAAPKAEPAAAAPTPSSPTPSPGRSEPIGVIPTKDVKVPPPPSPPSSSGSPAPSGQHGVTRGETRVKMNRMRQRIAQRLKDAQNTYAMLTTFNEIDMTNVIEMRNRHKDNFLKKHNLKLGFMSAFVRASAFALQDQPVVNAVIDDNEIIYRDYIDISVAVATPKGLVVPVLRNCGNMNYAEIEKAIAELGEKARNNALAIEDMDGGTFTISNGGVFGSMFGTPIINPPQSAILGMHAIIERPVAISGKVEIRPMMYIALTYDHRLVDGREAVLFLRKIKAAVEDPRIMLLDI